MDSTTVGMMTTSIALSMFVGGLMMFSTDLSLGSTPYYPSRKQVFWERTIFFVVYFIVFPFLVIFVYTRGN
jgi:cell division protein FtsW (lipid II flippase)